MWRVNVHWNSLLRETSADQATDCLRANPPSQSSTVARAQDWQVPKIFAGQKSTVG
jgi:hypothetical protein